MPGCRCLLLGVRGAASRTRAHSPIGRVQNWLTPFSPSLLPQSRAVQNTVDDINSRFGRGTIMYLSAEPIKM